MVKSTIKNGVETVKCTLCKESLTLRGCAFEQFEQKKAFTAAHNPCPRAKRVRPAASQPDSQMAA